MLQKALHECPRVSRSAEGLSQEGQKTATEGEGLRVETWLLPQLLSPDSLSTGGVCL